MSINKVVRISAVILSIFFFHCNLYAQKTISLNIASKGGEGMNQVELSVQKSDSTIFFALVDSTRFSFKLPEGTDYRMLLFSMGYKPYQSELSIKNDTTLSVSLEVDTLQLGEVVVKGRIKPKATAVGENFKLSRKARSCGDPFRALSEIPLLQVDIANQNVTLRSGETPLILIDGRQLNTGIKPIDPKFIESVDISEVVSAKYLQMGVTKIINIHLKRDVPLYEYVEARTRHDIPLRYGFGGANFEIGTSKVALYGSIFEHYLHNDKSEFNSQETLNGTTKTLSGDRITRNHSSSGDLLLKWVPSTRDYFAAEVKWLSTTERSNTASGGQYSDDSYCDMDTYRKYKSRDGGLLAALYNEHKFKDEGILSTFLKYNRGFSDTNDRYSESVETDTTSQWSYEKSERDQYTVTIDYTSGKSLKGELAVGNNYEYTVDYLHDRAVDPHVSAEVRTLSNYTYASYTNSLGPIYYMLSAGIQVLRVNAEKDKNSYWRPRAAVSLTWKLNSIQSVRGSYYLTNSLPESSQLITFDHSSNPWLRIEGNPYLVPVRRNLFSLNYDLSLGDFRIQLFGSHNRYNDMIESYLRDEGDMEIQSYMNHGTYKGSSAGGRLTYSNDNFIVSASGTSYWDSYMGQATRQSTGISGYARWDFGNFFIYTTISWRNKSYSPIGYTDYRNPTEAHCQLTWQVNRHLQFTLGVPYFWGVRSDVAVKNSEGYYSRVRTRYKSSSLRPWLLVSWTLRKNAKNSIEKKMPSL